MLLNVILKRSLVLILSSSLVLCTTPVAFAYQENPSPSSTQPVPTQAPPQTPEQLHHLVAPIALYPDALVAQVLAAATYPEQVVEADRWIHQNANLKGQQLADEVDK